MHYQGKKKNHFFFLQILYKNKPNASGGFSLAYKISYSVFKFQIQVLGHRLQNIIVEHQHTITDYISLQNKYQL